MKNEFNTIGKRIKARMVALGITGSELAATLSYSRQHISHLVKGRSKPNVNAIPALARALECSIEWLLTGSDRAPKARRR